MKSKTSYALLALLIAALYVNAALAQPREKNRPFGGRERLGEVLELSDEQKAQMRQIMLEARKKNISTEAQHKLARLELHELMGAESPDLKKIDAKISEVSKLRETMMRSRIESRLAMQKLLTPEQRKKLQELRPFERFRHGRGDFGGHGMGWLGHDGPAFGGEEWENAEEL